MQVKGTGSDAFRVSISSAPSTSSHGSAPEDCDAVGDVYVWGEDVSGDGAVVGYSSCRADALLPRPLECNLPLDVHQVACGVRHAAVVTRQGEIFTWGKECGGCLGHGFGNDVVRPRRVEYLTFTEVELVSCGEFHTCAVTGAGELYAWGSGGHNSGLLGLGTDPSGRWMPKRISGPLDGLQVISVSCGTWHTALIMLTGRLFTYGDGTFGALGHGDRQCVSYPREVESLSGLKTVAVACGVWHTAAAVEVTALQSGSSLVSGKLFTWGDGDKNRLGHGDGEPRLKPTCVPTLIDHDFRGVACGHSSTVGLTTSGRVFTMGSTIYGQLGNPHADGMLPCPVGDKLLGESVEQISSGAYHIVVLTARNEVYSWGKGANGRLGHGDAEDRKTPTFLEALKDRHVKHIACGANYTAAICVHKWASGAEQPQCCSSCRQPFGFTRKRHNCYNCGLVHCHSCSSRKATRAVLASNPGKPFRVCDSCFAKLSRVSSEAASSSNSSSSISSSSNRRRSKARASGENRDQMEKSDLWFSKVGFPSNVDLIKQLDSKAVKHGKKTDVFSHTCAAQPSSLLQLKDVISGDEDMRWKFPKSVVARSGLISRSTSPFSRRSSPPPPPPPRSLTPVQTTSGFSKSLPDSLKRTNELLNQEVHKLRAQVENMKERFHLQELELQKSEKKAEDAMKMAAEESAKSKTAKEVIKSLTAQMKDMSGRLQAAGNCAGKMTGVACLPNGIHYSDSNGEQQQQHARWSSSPSEDYCLPSPGKAAGSISPSTASSPTQAINDSSSTDLTDVRFLLLSGSNGGAPTPAAAGATAMPAAGCHAEAEWIDQFEPGVYITLVSMPDGMRDLKRVRFSRRRFGEKQAEFWWSENREKVYEAYNVRGVVPPSSHP